MASTPAYAATPKIGIAQITTADTSRTAPTNAGTVWSAGASGGRIDVVHIVAIASTTAGSMVRLFIHDGTNFRLLKEVPMLTLTASATQAVASTSVTFDGGLAMQTGYSLRATTDNGDDYNVIAQGADF